MMGPEGIEVTVGLPAGDPGGIRVAEIPTGIVRAVLVPRSMLGDLASILAPKEAEEHPECKAVYFLLGTHSKSEVAGKPQLYVGQTDTPWERFAYHKHHKDFDAVIVVVSTKDCGFSYDDILWLEWYGIKQAMAANRFDLTNERIPDSHSALNCKGRFDVFNTIKLLVSVLGFLVFEPEDVGDAGPADSGLVDSASKEVFYCRGEDAEAMGVPAKNGFLVRKGSFARQRIAPASRKVVGRVQKRLLDEGVIVEEGGGKLRFTRDYTFGSSSGSASLVLGHIACGPLEWETKHRPKNNFRVSF